MLEVVYVRADTEGTRLLLDWPGRVPDSAARAETTDAQSATRARRRLPFLPRRLPGGADPIPEATASGEVLRPASWFRRSLAFADTLSAAVAFALAVYALEDGATIRVAAIAILPAVALFGKLIGLYDRDAHRIQKTTLDEAPGLFQVSTCYALAVYLGHPLLVHGRFERGQVLFLWLALFVFMLVSRTLVRKLIQSISAPERCLVIGDADSAREVHRKFLSSHNINGV